MVSAAIRVSLQSNVLQLRDTIMERVLASLITWSHQASLLKTLRKWEKCTWNRWWVGWVLEETGGRGEILGSRTKGSLEDWGQGRGCYINRQVLSQSREVELQGPGNTEQGD